MKKIIILLSAVLTVCIAMSVLVVPVSAAEDYQTFDLETITGEAEYGELDCWSDLTIASGAKVTAEVINVHGHTLTVESGATVTTCSLCISSGSIAKIEAGATVVIDGKRLEFMNSTFEIAGTLRGKVEYLDAQNGTVKLMPGGKADVSFDGSERSARKFADVVSDYCVKCNGDHVIAQYDHEPGNGVCSVCGAIYDENLIKITQEDVIDGVLFITEAGDYFIPKDLVVKEFQIDSGVSLLIPDGVTLLIHEQFYNFGTIIIYGALDVSECTSTSNPGGTIEVHSCLGGEINGDIFGGKINRLDHTGTWTCIYCGEEFTENKAVDHQDEFYWMGSAISEGNLAIICAVASAAVFGFGGFFLGRKKNTVQQTEE